MEITSAENETYKKLLSLTRKKHRRELGLCIVEGFRIVSEHFNEATQIFVRKSVYESLPDNKLVYFLKGEKELSQKMSLFLRRERVQEKLIILADKLFDSITNLETDPGILAVLPIPKPRDITFPFLVLDRISIPGNVGTLLRTALAFGFNTVFCIDCADPYSEKVLRASSGIQFKLNIIELSTEEFLKIVGELNSTLFIADLNGTPEFKIQNEKFGLVLGNEGVGASAEIKKIPHKIVTIPMRPACESLNVAVAGGILMYNFNSALYNTLCQDTANGRK